MDSFTRWGLPELPETRITGIGVNDMKKFKFYYLYGISGILGLIAVILLFIISDNPSPRILFLSIVFVGFIYRFFQLHRESKNEVKENDNGQ